MNRILAFLLLLTLTGSSLLAQEEKTIEKILTGSWKGAFIRNNAHQRVEMEFSNKEDDLVSLQMMEEWFPSFGEFEVPVEIDSLNRIRFNTGYGKALLKLDENHLELVGHLESLDPSVYIHLKKEPPGAHGNFVLEPIRFKNGAIELNGHLHMPEGYDSKTAVILVGGRGCWPDATAHNLYAKFLRDYGVSVLAYQKRGTGDSGGDCSTATITDLATDLVAARNYLKDHLRGFKKIGTIGISAGGWTMARAEEITDFDFMISIVGPSTSVYAQQMQAVQYGSELFKLNDQARQELEAYTKLLFEAQPGREDFQELSLLLDGAESSGWRSLLDDTDIASSPEEIGNLWVQRHAYDPAKSLSSFTGPFMAIYGDRDWIVPPEENLALLHKYFGGDRKTLLTTHVAYQSDHGLETESGLVTLPDGSSYWHFYRISPVVRIELINFLRRHKLIK